MQSHRARISLLEFLPLVVLAALPILLYLLIAVVFFDGLSSMKWYYVICYVGFCIWFCSESIEGQIKKLWEQGRRRWGQGRRGQVGSVDPSE